MRERLFACTDEKAGGGEEILPVVAARKTMASGVGEE